MSNFRPTLSDGSTKPCMSNGTAYLMILKAIQTKSGLIHGKLHERGQSCAIGSYFDINGGTSLPNALINEVAAVNDSVPNLSNRARKSHVARWLKWKLTQLGMHGFRTVKR